MYFSISFLSLLFSLCSVSLWGFLFIYVLLYRGQLIPIFFVIISLAIKSFKSYLSFFFLDSKIPRIEFSTTLLRVDDILGFTPCHCTWHSFLTALSFFFCVCYFQYIFVVHHNKPYTKMVSLNFVSYTEVRGQKGGE